MTLDSHQHFWNYAPEDYPWIDGPKSRIAKTFLPGDLEVEQRPLGLQGSIAVQARQSIHESDWLLQLADGSPVIKGVVGWVDLRAATVEQDLGRLSKHPKFVGLRHVVQDEPDDSFMLKDSFLRGIGLLERFGLAYDILIFPKQLPAAIELARRFPHQNFVVDHIAKPSIKSGVIEPWRTQIQELGRCSNVFCKISGMVTEASWNDWTQADFEPYLDVVWRAFGPDRLMFGSDWPVCLLAGTYADVHGVAHRFFQQFDSTIQNKFFGVNAARFYGVSAS